MPARPRRRAVGPPGARPVAEQVHLPGGDDGGDAVEAGRDRPHEDRDDQRLRDDRPPHHDRGV